VADFDGDGTDDLAYWDVTGLRLLEGRPDGTLAGGDRYYVPERDNSSMGHPDVVAADFDRDGDVDTAVVTLEGLALLRNDGRGGFLAPRFGTYGYAVGDFNNDGRDDVLDRTAVRLAGSDGAVARASRTDLLGSSPVQFGAAGDLNRDGKLDAVWVRDLFASPTSGRIRIRLGNGDGTLGPPAEIAIGRRIEDLALADFDGDGNLDVLVVNQDSDPAKSLLIASGNGDGTFDPAVSLSPGQRVESVETGDFNGDGRVDLAVVTSTGLKPLQVALNTGGGAFGTLIGISENTEAFAVADVNGDGRSDVIAGEENGPNHLYLDVFLSNGDGTFTQKPRVTGGAEELMGIHVRDFNGDGRPDLLLATGASPGSEEWFAFLAGDGAGGFAPPSLMRSTREEPTHIGDFNGDGRPDLLDGGFVRLNTCIPRRRSVRH